MERVRQLLALRAIGINSAWLFVMEFFGWREFSNRRQVGALAGLVGSPFSSGETNRDLGISKAGNRHIRALAIEIADHERKRQWLPGEHRAPHTWWSAS